MTLRRNNRGSALIVSLILGVFTLSVVALYGWYSLFRSRENVTSLNRRRALDCADSGLNEAVQWLRFPASATDPVLGGTGFRTFTAPCSNGRYETVLSTRNAANNPHYLLADSTGYYYDEKGPAVDPDNMRPAQMAAVHSTILFVSVTKFFAAVNNTLTIAAGTDLTGASIYSDTLVFVGGAPTLVGQAFYKDNVFNENGGSNISNVTTDGITPLVPQQLSLQLTLPTANNKTRQLYTNRSHIGVGSYCPGANCPDPSPGPSFMFSIVPTPPNNSHVYYVDGNVDIGTNSTEFFVDGVYTIYATGNITIHNNIKLFNTSTSWLGLVAEGTIHIATDAPDDLTLMGNFVANGGLQALGMSYPRPFYGGNCAITLNGGIIGWTAPDIANVWASPSCTRTYQYPTAILYPASKSPALYLPSLSNVLDYTITHGRYR